jgi:hypothetical protein
LDHLTGKEKGLVASEAQVVVWVRVVASEEQVVSEE